MSLLHKALKKAEKENETHPQTGPMVDGEEESSQSSSTRIFFLTGLIILSLSVLIYVKFFKSSSVAEISPKIFLTPLQIAGGPSSEKLAEEAQSLIQAGKLAEARTQLEKVVILEPRSVEAYNNLGYVLKKLGKNEEAFEQYKKALSLNDQCSECLNNLGVLYLSTRDLAEAEGQFQKAVLAKADYADPYFHLGMLAEARGDWLKAKQNYLKYVELARGVESNFLLKIQNRIAGLQIP